MFGLYRRSILFCVLFVASTLCGCAGRVAFTDQRASIFTPEEIPNLQFFSSGRIRLQRLVVSRDTELTQGGRVVSRRGRLWEIVLVRDNTPCRLLGIDDDGAMRVTFEEGTEFRFIRNRDVMRNAPIDAYVMETQRLGDAQTVTFRDQTFELDRRALGAHLSFKRSGRLRIQRDREILRGVRVQPG